MKKFLIYFFIIIMFSAISTSLEASGFQQTQNAEISKIENDLYGFDYINDELKNRVARLEKTIYGKEFSGNLSDRIKKMAKDINADQIGLEIPPTEDTFREDEESIADNTVDYPVVDAIEMKLFNKTYKNKDFHSRIVGIERKVFGKIYDIDDYSTRMDRIKTAVMPETLTTDSQRFDYNNHPLHSSDLSGTTTSRYSGLKPFGQRNYTRQYTNYGDYPSENSFYEDDELAELEYNTFGTEFSDDDTKTRLKRLNSVNKAKKSSRKYDSQKFQQRMSAAMEIGAMILMILAMVL